MISVIYVTDSVLHPIILEKEGLSPRVCNCHNKGDVT